MSLLKAEPFAAVESMEELLAIAYAMEQEAVSGYSALADRMRRENEPALADVFDRLVAEETAHLGNVVHWSERISGRRPDLAKLRWELNETFDDEGAATVAPQLLSAYRAFSMAVRNEERAFVFWAYVAAQAASDDLREAAEEMAREEMGHIATLRRERRRAFHAQLAAPPVFATDRTLVALERRLAEHLEAASGSAAGDADAHRELARQARARAESLAASPLGESALLRSAAPGIAQRMAPLCELLLDCYLDLADRLPEEEDRARAQDFAAGAVHCLSALRHGKPA